MRLVISLGGTALLARGERPDAATQRRHVRAAARTLAPVARDHQLLICHSNGAQIGTLALESENDDTLTRPYPLDVLSAQTQGMIGYWLTQELRRAGVTRPVVAVVTQSLVDAADPGFRQPSAFVGPGYTREQIQLWAGELGWQIAYDGSAWRRVVPAVDPIDIVELPTIGPLVDAGALVVCGGGGGVAVCAEDMAFAGVDALIDADRTAALLAERTDADRLVLLTDIAEVRRDYGTDTESPIARLDLDELAALHVDPATMGAKLDAARRFVQATGRDAVIGACSQAAAVVAGLAGTTLTPSARSVS